MEGGNAVLTSADSRQKMIDFAGNFFGEYTLKQSASGDKIIPKLCPLCHGGSSGKDKNTFALFLDNGMYVCKRGSCGRHGRFEDLVKELSGQEIQIARSGKNVSKSEKQYVLPNTITLPPTDEIYEYFQKRGISKETVDAFKIASDMDGNIVFQFFLDGVNVYEKYRRPKKPSTPEEMKRKEWQFSGAKPILYNMDNVVFSEPLIITEGQCFNGDAEIMTPDGWVRFEDYAGQEVMQVDNDLAGSFVKPKAYIAKRFTGEMVDVSVGGNYYSSTTHDHNIVYMNKDGNFIKIQAGEHTPTNLYVPTTICHNGDGIDLSYDMIALMLAISADGSIDTRIDSGYNGKHPDNKHYVRFGLSKQRKIDRLCALLDRIGIQYSNNVHIKDGKEYNSICFSCPDNVAFKYLPWDLVTKTSWLQKRFIIDEMVHWDGNTVPNRNQYEYSTIIKHNADVIQAIAHMCGYMSTIMKRKSGGNGSYASQYSYKVSVLLNKHVISTQQYEKHKVRRQVDQSVYCVTVPTGMILVRQNNCISVSGNCDAMALYEAGLKNVVSVPSGCDNLEFVSLCWDWLEKFKTIILFGDNDPPGKRMVDTLIKRLGEYRVLVVRDYPEIENSNPVAYCKDANEVLLRNGEATLIEMVDNAEEIQTKGLIRVADIVPIDPTKVPRIKTMIPALDDAIGGLADGCVTLFTGKSGNGKSTLSGQILLNAIEQGHTCAAYSGELSAGLFQEWILAQACGSDYMTLRWDPVRGRNIPFVPQEVQQRILAWLGDRLLLYDNDEQFVDMKQADAIISVFTQAARKYNAKLFLIDNMLTSVADSDDEWRAQAMFINAIKKFATHYQAHVMLVAHPRKTKLGSDITQDDISGTSAIMNLCDNAIVIKRPDLSVLKNRLDGKQVSIQCCYCPDSRRIYQADKGDLNKFSWDKSGIIKPEKRACDLPEFEPQMSQQVPF